MPCSEPDPEDAGAYDGPCLNCSSLNHLRLNSRERECWNCFTVFTAPSTTDQEIS